MKKYYLESAQAKAYARRNEIKVGDRFRWTFSEQYGTSGKLRKDYMYCPDRNGEKIMIVCKVYEGKNGYGDFVDYWLSESGDIEKDAEGFMNGIIINGVDALKMERV